MSGIGRTSCARKRTAFPSSFGSSTPATSSTRTPTLLLAMPRRMSRFGSLFSLKNVRSAAARASGSRSSPADDDAALERGARKLEDFVGAVAVNVRGRDLRRADLEPDELPAALAALRPPSAALAAFGSLGALVFFGRSERFDRFRLEGASGRSKSPSSDISNVAGSSTVSGNASDSKTGSATNAGSGSSTGSGSTTGSVRMTRRSASAMGSARAGGVSTLRRGRRHRVGVRRGLGLRDGSLGDRCKLRLSGLVELPDRGRRSSPCGRRRGRASRSRGGLPAPARTVSSTGCSSGSTARSGRGGLIPRDWDGAAHGSSLVDRLVDGCRRWSSALLGRRRGVGAPLVSAALAADRQLALPDRRLLLQARGSARRPEDSLVQLGLVELVRESGLVDGYVARRRRLRRPKESSRFQIDVRSSVTSLSVGAARRAREPFESSRAGISCM